MKTSDFEYFLPIDKIAQIPIEPRDASRLMVLDRMSETIAHLKFTDICKFLHAGDVIVINTTRVIPARLFGHKESGGKVEILLLHHLHHFDWEALVGGKHVPLGSNVHFSDGVTAQIIRNLGGARRVVHFSKPVNEIMQTIGLIPLPPYIHKDLKDKERYQTVYSFKEGSSAAPTAGLHFTKELLRTIENLDVAIVELTLHIGLDTFAPVNEENIEDHQIHRELCELNSKAAEVINKAHASGGKVIAIGTTSVRTLETAADVKNPGFVKPFCGETSLFITPGYHFHVVDAMVTNFHLPKSTLLMLVSAFAGREFVMKSYQEAISNNYRFYSFGDAMLIL